MSLPGPESAPVPAPPPPAPPLDQHKLAAARLMATTRFPYLASAIFATPVLEAPALERVVVDEWWRVHADPATVEAWSVPELAGALVHLTGHLLRDHADRARAVGLADEEELHHWVDAADAELDDDLPADLARPTRPAAPGDLDCGPGRLAEEYYRTGSVREDAAADCGSGAHGRTDPFEPPPPAEGEEGVTRDQQELLRQRVAADVLNGDPADVPPGLRRWAEARRTARVDWRDELAVALRRAVAAVAGAADYSYARPSRRASVAGQVVLPSLRRPVPEVAVVCDTSASVPEELLAAALAEVDGVLAAVGTRGVRVLACDDAVQAVARVRRPEDVVLIGGGATDMGAGLAAALDNRPRPHVVVVLTDGWTPWPDDPPGRVHTVVGLLEEAGADQPAPEPPAWARTVRVPAPGA